MIEKTPLEIEEENLAKANERDPVVTRELVTLEEKVAVIKVTDNATNEVAILTTNRKPEEL